MGAGLLVNTRVCAGDGPVKTSPSNGDDLRKRWTCLRYTAFIIRLYPSSFNNVATDPQGELNANVTCPTRHQLCVRPLVLSNSS